MERIFGPDSKFYKYGTLFCDLVIVVILWIICCIPVITIGASTTALYYVTTRQLSNREGYVTKDFFKSFKSNFFEATAVTLILLLFSGIISINLRFFNPDTTLNSIIYLLQYVVLYEILVFSVYVFPVLSRFNLKFGSLIKTTFFMANRHLFTSISCLVLIAAIFMILKVLGILVVLAVGFYAVITSLMFMNLFRKYVPDMDKDRPEDKI